MEGSCLESFYFIVVKIIFKSDLTLDISNYKEVSLPNDTPYKSNPRNIYTILT